LKKKLATTKQLCFILKMNYLIEVTNYETGEETKLEIAFYREDSSFDHLFGTERDSEKVVVEFVMDCNGKEVSEMDLKEIYRTTYEKLARQIEDLD
jgi:hypothetical protein